MIIIAGHELVDEAERDRCVAAYREMLGRAREADGCIDVAITADPLDPRRINNLEVWRDRDALDAWRARADAPDTGVEPFELRVYRYDATDGGPLFG